MRHNPEDNPTPIFIDNSWKTALAYLKTLPLAEQTQLLGEMHQGLAQEAERFRADVRASGASQAQQHELLRACASITGERRTR